MCQAQLPVLDDGAHPGRRAALQLGGELGSDCLRPVCGRRRLGEPALDRQPVIVEGLVEDARTGALGGSGATRSMIAILPSGRQTRTISDTCSSGRSKWWTAKRLSTRSNASSTKGM
ncbi:MAG: hypothetical protein QOE38_185, partial [Thermoleophilaceae bacterium]|nr:hypothetical protein [Thermoleophilaceae bacterium]